VDDATPSNGDAESLAGTALSEAQRRELKRGLVAAVVGGGVDDAASSLLTRQLTVDPNALEPVIAPSLSDPSRLAAVAATGLMGGGANRAMDTVALLAAEALATPFVAISLLDDSTELVVGCNVAGEDFERIRPADLSIAKFTVVSGIPFIVDDATAHPLLASHPSVLSGAVGAYAGVPIFSDDDDAVGSLYAWDTRAVDWTGGQILVLQDMADLASAKIFRRPI
jgi:hypothetical protein